jgi:hypothetical protein
MTMANLSRFACVSLLAFALIGSSAHGREITAAQCQAIHALMRELFESELSSLETEKRIRERLLYTYIELEEISETERSYGVVKSLRSEIQSYLDERDNVDHSIQDDGIRAYNEACT